MSTQPSTQIVATPQADSAELLLKDLPASHVLPLWAQMSKLNPPAPNPTCVPHIWKYDEIRPQLLRAGKLITEKQAERRVLMLINPARVDSFKLALAAEAPYTTDTVYAGLQLVMPNETAPAHRHVAFAMRFIIEGNGGFTAVHGSRIKMNRGDVILTPTMNWHDHGNDESGPMIWLDGLDLPNYRHFPVHFVEHFAQPRYPANDVDTSASPIVFPWSTMKMGLDSAEGEWATRPYLKKDGREVSKVLGGSAERLNAGSASLSIRETSSCVYHIIEGTGHSIVDGKKIVWKKSDTFCIPAWHEYQHFADVAEIVYLYRFDDKPMLNALGWYRKDGVDVETFVSD